MKCLTAISLPSTLKQNRRISHTNEEKQKNTASLADRQWRVIRISVGQSIRPEKSYSNSGHSFHLSDFLESNKARYISFSQTVLVKFSTGTPHLIFFPIFISLPASA